MSYSIIQPPSTLKFREMPRKELREYFGWYLEIMPQRIRELTEAANKMRDFETWNSDCSPDSLKRLGHWFLTRVQRRRREPDEIRKIQERSAYPINVSEWELTDETFSLAF